MTTMLARKWKTVDGETVTEEMIKNSLDGLRTVHIGTDSQQSAMNTEFITVIVVHTPGKGGRAFYTRETTPRIKSLRERLLKEVWLSVQLGMELNGTLNEESELMIHVDANPNVKFKSSKYVKELTSLVASQGFSYMIKPDAWVAMHVADHVVKKKVIGRS